MPNHTMVQHDVRHSAAVPTLLGEDLASGTLGAGVEPTLGPAVGRDRDVMTGMRPAAMSAKFKVPGYPQDMMEMHGMLSPAEMRKVNVPLTRGMRRNWPMGTQAMMTTLRVLPDELYEKVVSGKGDIPPGASVPGAGPGKGMHQQGHERHGEHPAQEQGKHEHH
jgi:hypothetical protein